MNELDYKRQSLLLLLYSACLSIPLRLAIHVPRTKSHIDGLHDRIIIYLLFVFVRGALAILFASKVNVEKMLKQKLASLVEFLDLPPSLA